MIDAGVRERLDRIERELAEVQARLRGAASWRLSAALRGAPEFAGLKADHARRDVLRRRRAMLLEAYRGE